MEFYCLDVILHYLIPAYWILFTGLSILFISLSFRYSLNKESGSIVVVFLSTIFFMKAGWLSFKIGAMSDMGSMEVVQILIWIFFIGSALGIVKFKLGQGSDV